MQQFNRSGRAVSDSRLVIAAGHRNRKTESRPDARATGENGVFERRQQRGPQQPHYYDTAPLGIVSLAAGVAVAGAGIYFLVRPRATSLATVAPLPGGAAVGWAGRF